uniref:Protein SMG9 n=1 Tax=Homalodisca liturata TaxID=320908 RepID=A0A1B6K1W7_9HEMI
MGDNPFGDRGRDTRKKKFFPSNREKDERTYGTRKLTVILTKPDGEKDREGKSFKGRTQDNSEKPLSQPTIILRNPGGDNRAVSPSQRTARAKKESETSAPTYHIAAKHSNSESTNALALPVEMKSSVKLIDDQFQILDTCVEYLTDQTDFLVVGCVGLQGVGKSTLMSHLAGSSPNQLLNTVFKSQTMENQREWKHCTSGVDFYITPNRVVLLDCQPILSSSVMDCLIQDPKKIVPPTHNSVDLSSTENAMEVQSLQVTAFLMSVCHVVLLVQDWFYNPNIVRFMQTAAMLKPRTNTTADEGLVEYFPHLMFVHTHAHNSDFSVQRVKLMQDVYKQSFGKSLLQLHSGLGIANGGVMHTLSPFTLDQEPLNLFLLPPLVDQDVKGHFQGHPGYEDLLRKMKQQLQGIGTCQLSTSQLSEKNWFHYATKVWEGIKKSTFFQEYSRLLP